MRTACFTIKNGPMNGGYDMRILAMHDFADDCLHPEDDNAWFVSEQGVFALVADGCSEPYFGKQFMYPGGLTGGQKVVRTIRQAFSSANPEDDLGDVVIRANEEIWNIQQKHRGNEVHRDDPATLANASFSCLKFDRKARIMEVIWGADVFTIWVTRSGKVNIVGGDNRDAEMERERRYVELVADAHSDHEKEKAAQKRYWLEEFPRLKRKHDNVEYSILNGSLDVATHWHREVVKEPIDFIVVVSDGAWIPMEDWGKNPVKAKYFVQLLKNGGGWDSALPWIREQQNHGLTNQRVKRPEAAGLAIFAE